MFRRRVVPFLATSRRVVSFRPQVERLEARELLSLSTTIWTPIGPAPIVGGPFPASGRINVVVSDPTNANVAYVGSDDSGDFGAGGGIWKTSNFQAATPV